MIRSAIGALGLVILWLLLSGLFDKTLILIFGALSVVFAMWMGKRMDLADGAKLEYTISALGTIKYLFWLFGEIAKSNIAVAKIILARGNPDRQRLLYIPSSQKCDLAQVIYANSITLTPATITVETEPHHFLVHALDFEEGDLEGLADMDRRVTAVETADARRT